MGQMDTDDDLIHDQWAAPATHPVVADNAAETDSLYVLFVRLPWSHFGDDVGM